MWCLMMSEYLNIVLRRNSELEACGRARNVLISNLLLICGIAVLFLLLPFYWIIMYRHDWDMTSYSDADVFNGVDATGY